MRSNVTSATVDYQTSVSSKQGRSNDAEHTDVTENYKGHMVDYNHDVVRDTMLIPNNINQWGEENYELTGYINDVNTEYTQVLMEYSKSGMVNNIYEYGIQRESMSWYGRKGYYAYDGRGSVADVTGSASQTMIQYKYNNYGETSSLVNGYNNYVRNPYRYNAERTDEVAGVPDQQYLRARYYNANMGRFLTSDTYLGRPHDPLSLSLYAYCGNNPVNYTDPSGHYRSPQQIQQDHQNKIDQINKRLSDISIMTRYTENTETSNKLYKESIGLVAQLDELKSEVWDSKTNKYIKKKVNKADKEKKAGGECVITESNHFRDPRDSIEQAGYDRAISALNGMLDMIYTPLENSKSPTIYETTYLNNVLARDVYNKQKLINLEHFAVGLAEIGLTVAENVDMDAIRDAASFAVGGEFRPLIFAAATEAGKVLMALMDDSTPSIRDIPIIQNVFSKAEMDYAEALRKYYTLDQSIYKYYLEGDPIEVSGAKNKLFKEIDSRVTRAKKQLQSEKSADKRKELSFYIDTLLRAKAENMLPEETGERVT